MAKSNMVNKVAAGIVSIVKATDAAAQAFGKVQRSQLEVALELYKGVPAINSASWTHTYAEPVKAALQAAGYRNTEDSNVLSQMMSLHHKVAVGFTQQKIEALKVQPADTNLQAYVRNHADALKQHGYVPGNAGNKAATGRKGGQGAGKTTAPKAKGATCVEVTREGALAKLCDNDKARMQALDDALKLGGAFWDAVNVLVAQLVKAA